MLAAALVFSGCLTPRTPPVRTEVAGLRARVEEIAAGQARIEQQIRSLQDARQGGGLPSTEVAALDARINALEGQLSTLRQKLDDTLDRIRALSQDLKATRELALRVQPPRMAPSAPPAGDGEDAGVAVPEASTTGLEDAPAATAAVEDVYSAAYADYTKGNYALAIAGFQDFLKRYPKSELADNARYWIAEALFAQDEFEAAAVQFDVVITQYPEADKVPAAMLKKGLCLVEMDRAAEGAVLLQHLIQTYPKSEEASLARDQLARLGVRP